MSSIKNVDRLLSRLNNISNVDLNSTMVKATTVVHAQAKLLAPVNKEPGGGNLAGSIHMEVKEKTNKLYGRVFTNLIYAPFVEFGTGIAGNGTYPYKIKGLKLTYKNEKWLGYIPEVGWRYIAGQKAQPYMYPSLKQNEKYIKQLFKDALHKQLKNNCKGA